jgi:hypothetical protein
MPRHACSPRAAPAGLAGLLAALLLLLAPAPAAHATKFVANPASRLSRAHRRFVEQLWAVSVGQERLASLGV